MITTGNVRITCPGAKEKKQKPRALSELEVQVIKEWYDVKDPKLVGHCSGEVSSRSQFAAQARNWLLSDASQPKLKAQSKSMSRANGKAKVGSISARKVKNSSKAAKATQVERLRAKLHLARAENARLRLKVGALENALHEAKRQCSDADAAASEKKCLRVEAEDRCVLAKETLRHSEEEAGEPAARGMEDVAAAAGPAQNLGQASSHNTALASRPLGDAPHSADEPVSPPTLPARGMLAKAILGGNAPHLATRGWTIIKAAIPKSEMLEATRGLEHVASGISRKNMCFFHGISKNSELSGSAIAWRLRKLLIPEFGAVLSVLPQAFNSLLVSNDAVAFGDEGWHNREASNVNNGHLRGVPKWLHVDMSVEQLEKGDVADHMQGYLSLQGSVRLLLLEAFHVGNNSFFPFKLALVF